MLLSARSRQIYSDTGEQSRLTNAFERLCAGSVSEDGDVGERVDTLGLVSGKGALYEFKNVHIQYLPCIISRLYAPTVKPAWLSAGLTP